MISVHYQRECSRPYVTVGFSSVDLTNCRLKIFEKKSSCKKQNLNYHVPNTMLSPCKSSNVQVFSPVAYMQIQIMCRYYIILHKGLEHLQILVSEGAPGTNPQQTWRGNCIVLSLKSIAFIIALFLFCPNLFTILSVLFVKLFPRDLFSLFPLRTRCRRLTAQLSS